MSNWPLPGRATSAGWARRIADISVSITFVAVAITWVRWALPGTETINLFPVMIGAGLIAVFWIAVRAATSLPPADFKLPVQVLVWALTLLAVFGIGLFARAVAFQEPYHIAKLIFPDLEKEKSDDASGRKAGGLGPAGTQSNKGESTSLNSAAGADELNQGAVGKAFANTQPNQAITYYLRRSDGGKVVAALKSANLYYKIGTALHNAESNPTNAIACSPDADPATLKTIIAALTKAGVDIANVYRFEGDQKKGFELMNVSNYDGSLLDEPPLSPSQLIKINKCPPKRLNEQ
ncbi:hypothetical protein FS763_01475 [Agrobacterium vitis]|uniref:hypothetical protein n=1 Tax=Allorhizobium ampelinum TaxID=3025782 RepID=UPI001F3818E5|nr:hypothetical protein [Allorhizobium ampelinum]MCF1470600.1 hypothetical protein [Allorhizobium ampelinum]